MKDNYRIYVEGAADKRFIEQLITTLFETDITEGCVIDVGGYTNLISSGTKRTYIIEMTRTIDDGGVNLVIFDADDDINSRREELLAWKTANMVEFELFLLPDNVGCGALEDLLELIINPANKEVLDAWDGYEDAISHIDLEWRQGTPLTIPAKKTKIYAYLEVLLGKSKTEKVKIKEKNRDYTNEHHWNLKAESLRSLCDFLKDNLA